MLHTCRKLRLAGFGSYAPARIVPNQELAEQAPTDPQWVYDTLGIRERRVSSGELTSDLAAQAGLRAVADAGLAVNDIDLIIVATATPDRQAPSTACIVQHKMKITNRCAAFDIAAVCSGFLYAMTIGSQFIESNTYKTVLIIGADTFSTITDWSRRDCVFFGDGAGAVVLQRVEHDSAVYSSLLFADGAGRDNFTVYPDDQYFTMNGRAVYETGTTVLPDAIRRITEAHGVALRDVAAVVPHQPSIRMLQATAEALGIPFSKVRTNMERYANTSSATIPILLDEVAKEGTLRTGDWVVFAAVGSGWTWGSALYRWQ